MKEDQFIIRQAFIIRLPIKIDSIKLQLHLQ